MRKKKRFVAILLSLLMMFSLCCNVTFAEDNDQILDSAIVEETDEDTVETTNDETDVIVSDEADTIDEETSTNIITSTVETIDTSASDEVQALIDALPTVDELSTLSTDELNDVYTDLQDANDAYEALSSDEQSLVDVSKLDELFNYFNSLTMETADEETAVAQIGDTTYASVTEALAAVTDDTETTITMITNSNEDITISSDQSIVLDLNGYTLNGTGSGSVVTNSGTLTIKDSSGYNSGTITGGSATNKSGVTLGGGVYSSGSLTMTGGTISGNTARSGGGIYVTNTGSFTMSGGVISGNTAKRLSGDTTYVASNGGGINTQCEATITGGSILNNKVDGFGGGFYSNTTTTINASDKDPVIISENTAGTSGAGVHLGGGTISIVNVNITNNTLTGTTTNYYYAAGLSLNSATTILGLDNVIISGNSSSSVAAGGLGISAKNINMNDCIIKNNTSTSGAGGVCIYVAGNNYDKTFELNNCTITDNTGNTVGGLYVLQHTNTKYSKCGVTLNNTIVTGNTGVNAGGVYGEINMASGALYGNTSTDGNAANDWLIDASSVTNTSLSPNVSVLKASSMNDNENSFDNYLWIDAQNGLKLDSKLNNETLSNESAETFYFTAREVSYVAQITLDGSTTQYETIKDAIDAAILVDNNVTITLIANENSGYTITEDVTIPEDINITIDLNGCTINNKSEDYAITVSSGASLTLNGTGTVNGIDNQGNSLSIMGDIEVGTVKLAKDTVIIASDEFNPKSLKIVLESSVLKKLNDYSDNTDVVTLVSPTDGQILSEELIEAITITGANILVSVSMDDSGNIIASALELNGIFVDGVNGNDETGDGTYNNPVKSFTKAKELLEKSLGNNSDVDGIYVLNTITVNDTEEWSLDDLTNTSGEVSLMRFPTFTGILAVIGDNGDLTLSDITIDGQNITVDSSLIQVNGNVAELTISDGTVIQNNIHSSNSNLTDTEAAVTVVNGTLTMNGGTITGNTGYWGGGIALVADDDSKTATLNFNGGTISNNTANTGGGIFLYGNSTMVMNGGYIDSNTAYERGGGLSVWSGANAYVYAGYITNNQQVTDSASNETSYGGGAIYVNDSSGNFGYGTLYLYNVEITDNSHVRSVSTFNGYYDGTIAACNTSNVEIYVTDGAVIHDNHANYGNDITLYSDVYQENFTLSPVMLSGGAYNWVDRNGNPVDVTNLSQYRGVTNGLAFKSTATEVTGLDRVTTYITGNSAIRCGAAIGVNGNLIIGRDDGDVTLNITKDWGDYFDESSLPDSITVELYATDSKGVTADLGELTLTAENNWTVSVTDLPKYDSYYDSETQTSTTYTYTVVENSNDYFSIVYNEEVDDEDDNAATTQYDITVANLPITDLTIEKTIKGETSANEFTFQIDLSYQDVPYTGTIEGVDSEGNDVTIEFNNGTSTVILAADESITLTLGAGMTYTIEEIESRGALDVTYTIDDEKYAGTKVSNVLESDTEISFENNYETIDVSGTKTWDDASDQDGKRPESITVRLLVDGDEIDSQTVTAEDNWTYTFSNLAKYSNGEEINYVITEDAVENYSTTYDGYNITNSYTPEKTSITVVKAWDDSNDKDGIRPDEITVILVKDGETTDQTVILNADNSWEASFTDLDVYSNGVAIEYTVEEVSVDGYTSEITGSMSEGFVITNTLEETETPTTPTDPSNPEETPTTPSTPEESTPSETTTPSTPEENTPNETTTPTTETTPSTTTTTETVETNVQTGDNTNIALYALILIIAMIGIVTIRKTYKKKQ